ncbi:MAG: efflux RND transporter permease subunit [Alphaproteobacteria bacterium]|nr:efflux RND transporter permease subunit [Alphaproteobacteria bacterium]MCB9792124.1 efflux RND transporter permease subunit [Alphaproteobacteria bacterium]
MWLARFAVRQPVLVNMAAIVLTLAGALGFLRMTREELPEMSAWFSTVTVIYPGATPEDMEQLVLRPIEDEIGDLDYLKQHNGVGQEAMGQLFVEFEPEVPDLDRATMQLAQAVDRAELPEGAEAPVTKKWTQSFPAIQVAIRAEPDVPLRTLQQLSRAMERALDDLDGVHETLTAGLPERELEVRVDRVKAEALGVPLFAVIDAIEASGLNLPAGSLDGAQQELLVRTDQRFRGPEDVAAVVLREGPLGGTLRVGDLAEVIEGFADAEVTAEVDGQQAVLLTVMKSPDGDLLRVVAGAREIVAGFQAKAPPGVTLSLHADASKALDRTLGDLYTNGGMGLVLIALILGVFLGFRNSVMAALGLPVALAGGVLIMDALGITINMLSLFSLIVVLGIVVDDAIVVIENVVRYAERGHPLPVAAVMGTAQVTIPVIAATLTTISAFLPLLVMTGVLGKFFSIIPKVVAAALIASLIEALIVLPSHLADFGKVEERREPPAWFQAVLGRYEAVLAWALARRGRIITGVMALSAAMIALGVATLPVVLFTEVDADLVDVRVKMPMGTRLETTEQALAEMDARVREAVAPEMLRTVITQAGYARTDLFPLTGGHVGMLTVDLAPWAERDYHAEQVAADLREALADLPGPTELEVVMVQQGPPSGKPVAIEILGDDFAVLRELEREVRDALGAMEGVSDIGSDLDPGKEELSVRVREDAAARHGVQPLQVAAALRYAIAGGVATTWRDGQDALDVRVRYDDPGGPDALANLRIPTPEGYVPLGQLAELERSRGLAVLRHRDGVRRVKITADVDTELTTSLEVNQTLQARFADVPERLPGYSLHFGGEFEQVGESFRSLFEAFWIALLCIYTILGAQFRSFAQPLVVLSAVPFCFIGVVLGLLVTGSPFGMVAGIGAVALTGIVVNDSLVLVDFINGKRLAGAELIPAVLAAGKERVRPIFLTSITTIAGLMPLGLGWGGENPLLSPMATSIAWGLVFATGLTLVVVPCLYVSVDLLVQRITGQPTVRPEDQDLDDLDRLRRLLVDEAAEEL